MSKTLIRNYIQQLESIQDLEIWLGENFYKKLNSISGEQAFQRPLPELHTIAELISHLLVWRNEGINKLSGKSLSLTMESPENWKSNEELQKVGWDKLKIDFINSLREINQILEQKTDTFLAQEYVGGFTYQYLIEGLIHHDLYHLGQIGITIKFLSKV